MHAQANLVARRPVEGSAAFWALVAATGVGAGLAGGLLMRLFHALQHLAWSYDAGGFIEAVTAASPARRILVVLGAGALVTAGLLVLRMRKGGHALELTVSIWFRAGESPPLKTLVRSVLSIAIVAMGAAVGREGALKQTGAVIGHQLAAWRRLAPAERRLLTACGAGAGLAAAYNLPVGGAFFAMEVLLGTLTLPVALPTLAASILGAAASWLLLPAKSTYDTPAYQLSIPQLGWALAMGLVAGAAALAYTRLIAWANRDHLRGPAGTAVVAIGVFLALGVASVALPELLGNGRGVVQRTISGQFGSLPMVLAVLALRPFATALCLKSGAPGGLFTPTLTVGSLLGLVCGRMWSLLVTPGAAPNGSYAVIGAGAFLAACTGGPISTMIIMIELGRHIDLLIVPLGVAVVVATVVVRLFDAPSIYTAKLAKDLERAAPARGAADGPLANRIETDVLVIGSASSAIRTVQRLIATGAPTAYVVDETGALVGRLDPQKLQAWARDEGPRILETARDLSDPAPCVAADASPEEAKAKLHDGDVSEVAVIDAETRRLAGVVRRLRR